MKVNTGGEYKEKGDYHRKLDKKWKYLPIYLEKIKILDSILRGFKNKKILDVGCGEGVLVDKYKEKRFDIIGMDLNYSSKNVKKGNILNIPFKDEEFDLVLCLDVLEHLDISDHEKAMGELYRVSKKQGLIIFALPNLAHFASRVSFLLTGKLLRTSEVERHVGDRPIKEFINLMKDKKLKILKKIGLFPTFPILSLITIKAPSKSVFLHQIYNVIFPFSGICFENIIISKKFIKKIKE